jgi:RND superfamily putative drug exporter
MTDSTTTPTPTATTTPGRRDRLAALASWCYTKRRRVVLLWVVALVAVTLAAGSIGGDHHADYAMPGSQSAAVRDLLAERFPEQAGDAVYLVAHTPDGWSLTDPAAQARLTALTDELRTADHVAEIGAPLVAPDGRTSITTIQLDLPTEQVPLASVEHLITRMQASDGGGLQLELGGQAVQGAESSEAGSESIGLAVALLILLIAFGSALAAGIPIVMAVFGLGVGAGLTMLGANVIDVPDWGSQLAAMIGIGVGIDYALFIVTRFRTTLVDGVEPHEAVVTALRTSGRAVLFAGGTVIVSLLGLGAMGLDYLWGAALAMVMAVVCVLAASLTLLPAVLGFAGPSIDRLRVPGLHGGSGRSEAWASWSRRVQGHPVAFGLVALVLLVGLAMPVLGLRFGLPDAGTGPTSLTSRRAHDLVASEFGPGANGPLFVTVDGAPEVVQSGVADLAPRLAAAPGVAAVLPAQLSSEGTAAIVTVVPTSGPQDAATEDLVHELRGSVLPASTSATGARMLVGGATALSIDEAHYEGARLPWFIVAVLVMSMLLLLCVFRSPLVAVKAAVMNLLAIGASYGVISIAAQGGWLGQLIGIHEATPVPVFVPILMFAVLFGLSMDYEVFLLSRIREEHLRGRPNHEAVVEGVACTARVITAAAAIMIFVFGAYMLSDSAFVKLAGIGLATAVLLDATVVRLVLVPATMQLLGERNWWLPTWLDRLLPRIEVEGTSHPAGASEPVTPEPVVDLTQPQLVDA